MHKSPKSVPVDPCISSKSAFNYDLTLKPDGRVVITDECGKEARLFSESNEVPPIKEIVNTRTITIMETRGSQWIYVVPPGKWYRLS